ncbi:Nucleoside triphosphatase NudI [uncultured archaeon]|nr:Nucleoside triphosphatase NudI [uncultured archaeon]
MAFSGIILKKGEKFLLQLRDDKKEIAYPNHWSIFGGSIEPGETPMQAIIREVKEELGINIEKKDIRIFSKTNLDGIEFNIFKADLKYELNELTLGEGQAMELFSKEEILKLKNLVPKLREIFRDL